MPEQFRRVKKGKRSKTFRLAEEVRKAKVENERDHAVATFIRNIQNDVVALAMDEIQGDARLDAIRRRLRADPDYLPPIEVCAGIVQAAVFYATINNLDTELSDRLRAVDADLPDSLHDPDDL